jgi:hypothetical protein
MFKDRRVLILVGASYLKNLPRFMTQRSGRSSIRISEQTVQFKTAEIAKLAEECIWPRLLKHFSSRTIACTWWAVLAAPNTCPPRTARGTYHVDGELVVASKAGVKGLIKW